MQKKQTILKNIAYLGAAMCEGQGITGVQKAPQIIRQSGLFNVLNNIFHVNVNDFGDIAVNEQDRSKYPKLEFPIRNLNILGPYMGRLHQKAYQIIQKKQNDLLLTIGGDHSIATATISAIRRHYQNLKIVWIDAHPDLSNHQLKDVKEAYPNYHGMPLSHLTGITKIPHLNYWSWLNDFPLLDPKNVVLIGIRDIDPDEYITFKKHGIKYYTMDHIDMYGIGQVMKQTINHLDPKNQHPFHISFDIDAIDPEVVGQTGTKFRYGLTGRESVHIIRRLTHQRRVVSMDLVEINADIQFSEPKRVPFRSQDLLKPVSRTVGVGVDLITSLCTKYLQQ